jgi:hypothetical protein
MREIKHFLPARELGLELPLERFLDPLPADVVRRYCSCYTEPGDLVLDPIAQRPTLPLAGTQLDRKAIASNFNPINTLVIEGVLTLPEPGEIDSATARLGDSPKRGEPLRDHINSLYESTCGRCSNRVTVGYFVWEAEEDGPVQKRYDCPDCGRSGEFPVEDEDLLVLDEVETQGVHYWYLLERLAQPHDPERALAEELLQLYTSRNLYALVNISMKIEALFAGSPLQRTLQLILLSCLDSCSKLAAAPLPRASALRLQPPEKFLERNVWRAFEEAYRGARRLAPSPSINLANSPQQLIEEEVQALVLNEPVRSVASVLPPASVSLIIGAPRDYYRPYWTLSYLWSAWLWGQERAAPLRPLLRKTMGWTWYRRTLSAALQSLHEPLQPEGRMVFVLEGADLVQVGNLILAAVAASFKLEEILLQPVDTEPPRHPKQGMSGAYRLSFSGDRNTKAEPPKMPPDELRPQLRKTALAAIAGVLRDRGQALHLNWLHAAVWERWAKDGLLRQALALETELSAADFLDEELGAALDEGLESGLLELVPQKSDDESTPRLWWLRRHGYPAHPLGDQVEEAVRQVLRGASLSHEELEDCIYSRFPGLLTPQPPLLDQCLRSYATYDAASGTWLLRPEDRAEGLSKEKVDAFAALAIVGRRLGYQVWGPGKHSSGPAIDMAWEEGGTERQLFALKQTTRLGDVLAQDSEARDEVQRYIVLSERRLALLKLRMGTEPLLSRALGEGRWRFIKLNNLRALAARQELRGEDLEQIVGLEPVTESPDSQLPLFA